MVDAEHSPDLGGRIAPGMASRAPRTDQGTRLAMNELRRVMNSNTDRILLRLNQIDARVYFNELSQRTGESLLRVFGSISLTLLPLLAALFAIRWLPPRMDDLALIVSTFAILTSLLIGICIGLPILITNVHEYFAQESHLSRNRGQRYLRRLPQISTPAPHGGGDGSSDEEE